MKRKDLSELVLASPAIAQPEKEQSFEDLFIMSCEHGNHIKDISEKIRQRMNEWGDERGFPFIQDLNQTWGGASALVGLCYRMQSEGYKAYQALGFTKAEATQLYELNRRLQSALKDEDKVLGGTLKKTLTQQLYDKIYANHF